MTLQRHAPSTSAIPQQRQRRIGNAGKRLRISGAAAPTSDQGLTPSIFRLWVSHASEYKKVIATALTGSASKRAILEAAQIGLDRFAEMQAAEYPGATIYLSEILGLENVEQVVERALRSVPNGQAVVFLCEIDMIREVLIGLLWLPQQRRVHLSWTKSFVSSINRHG